jgi:hypothetical protein
MYSMMIIQSRLIQKGTVHHVPSQTNTIVVVNSIRADFLTAEASWHCNTVDSVLCIELQLRMTTK